MTIDEQIAQIEKAINAIELGAQEYEIDGMRIKRADLDKLYKRLEYLKNQKAIQQNNYSTRVFTRFSTR